MMKTIIGALIYEKVLFTVCMTFLCDYKFLQKVLLI
jgi:hypothetical protein